MVHRKDGTFHAFDFPLFLSRISSGPGVSEDFKRAWIAGSLITLGDALATNSYFDHAPELEMVYHLGNGVAHGNRFSLTAHGLNRLRRYPAHTKQAFTKSDLKTEFEITPSLQGQAVLFDFMDAADVLDLLLSVGMYLLRIANGQSDHT